MIDCPIYERRKREEGKGDEEAQQDFVADF
jgi:hypothetical protein